MDVLHRVHWAEVDRREESPKFLRFLESLKLDICNTETNTKLPSENRNNTYYKYRFK